MKKALTIGLAGAAVAATLSFVATEWKSESPVVSEAKADEPEAAPIVLAQVLNYDRGPRIIIVPQANGRIDRSRASISRDVEEDDDIPQAPVRTPRWAPRSESKSYEPKPTVEAPRRVETPVKSRQETRPETRSEPRKVRHIDMSKPKAKAETRAEPEADIPQLPIPQPPSPRRAVLSAPPPPAEGPSPIKPTPKFDAKLDSQSSARAESATPFDTSTPFDTPSSTAVGETPPPGDITADSPPPGYTPPKGMLRDEAGNRY